MFNDKSTHTERQQVLQSIMQKGSDSIGSDVHTDTEINRMLARSDAEYQVFQEVWDFLSEIAFLDFNCMLACSNAEYCVFQNVGSRMRLCIGLGAVPRMLVCSKHRRQERGHCVLTTPPHLTTIANHMVV